MYRNIFKHIHYPKINLLYSNKKYPWGWMPPNYIKSLIKLNGKKLPIDYQGDLYFYEPEFCDGALQAYKTVLNMYNDNSDFISSRCTSPSLSLIINKFIHEKMENTLVSYDIDNAEILDKWLEEEHTYGNHKVLGLWNNRDLHHYMCTGVIGPEITHIWCQAPIKQVVKVHFSGPRRNDVWLFEKCLMEENSFWQVKNINNIII